MLKRIVVLINTVFSLALMSTAFAADQGKQPTDQKDDQAKFQEKKQHLLDNLDRKIAGLQKARSCVAQAQNKDGLKDCRPEREHEGGRDRDHDRDRGKSKD
jgi:hypothetical protein